MREFVINQLKISIANKKDMVILGLLISAHGGIKNVGERVLEQVNTSMKKVDKFAYPAHLEIKAEILYHLTVHFLTASYHNQPLRSMNRAALLRCFSVPAEPCISDVRGVKRKAVDTSMLAICLTNSGKRQVWRV